MFLRISGIEPEKRVRRSSPKAAIGFGDCEVGSRLVLPVTARGCRHKPSAHRIPPSHFSNVAVYLDDAMYAQIR